MERNYSPNILGRWTSDIPTFPSGKDWQKNKRGDRKVESNEISDTREISDMPGLPSGLSGGGYLVKVKVEGTAERGHQSRPLWTSYSTTTTTEYSSVPLLVEVQDTNSVYKCIGKMKRKKHCTV